MAAHRYWRIKCTSGQPDYYIPELDLRESAGGTRLTGTPVWNTHRSAPSTEFDGTKAFDGVYNSFWQGSAVDSWVGLDLGAGSEKFVGWYGVMLGQYPSVLPPSFTLDYSDNGTTWTVADTQVAVAWGSGASTDVKSFLVTAPVVVPNSHTYWRLTGFLTDTNALELSQAQLYDGVQLIAQAPTFTVQPTAGVAFPDTLHWNDCTMPGFALVWNLATPVGNPSLRLGAGSSADNFPKEFYCQYSDDGKFWSTNNAPTNIDFPGGGLLTAEPGTGVAAVGDPDFAKVTLLLPFNEGTGTTTTNLSTAPCAVTLNSGASITSVKSKFGASSMSLVGGGTATTPFNTAFEFGSGDFTIEGQVWFNSMPSMWNYRTVISSDDTTSTRGWVLLIDSELSNRLAFCGYFGDVLLLLRTPSAPAIGQWLHFAVVRGVGYLRLYLNGVLQDQLSCSGNLRSTGYPLSFGGLRSGAGFMAEANMDGYLDEIRITKGVARYTAAFTPPTAAFPTSSTAAGITEFIPLSSTAAARRWRTTSLFAEPIAGAVMSAFNLSEFTPQETFMDAYHGGTGRIHGTVNERGTPDKVLHREVLLIDEASNVVIRKTWSDPITGAYEFIGVKTGVKYTVLSYDYANTYRAVIADGQIPESML